MTERLPNDHTSRHSNEGCCEDVQLMHVTEIRPNSCPLFWHLRGEREWIVVFPAGWLTSWCTLMRLFEPPNAAKMWYRNETEMKPSAGRLYETCFCLVFWRWAETNGLSLKCLNGANVFQQEDRGMHFGNYTCLHRRQSWNQLKFNCNSCFSFMLSFIILFGESVTA